MSTSAPLVSLRGVTAGYAGTPALRDVTLDVPHGAFSGIVGPSGSGKTTLLRLLLGGVRPAAGSITTRPGLRLGYVPQLDTVDWSFPLTVGECVLMARPQRRLLPRATATERRDVADVLERLGIADLTKRHIRALSGGQQQRMFLARALLGQPDLLLLDEPTSGVDVGTRHDVLHLLADLNEEGIAIVLTTHDLNGIAAHLPHLVCLAGRVVAQGPPRGVMTPAVLEETFGARMDVLEHLGMLVVVDGQPARTAIR